MSDNSNFTPLPKIVAVDFDGTCVEHEFPRVGPDVPHADRVLRRLAASGCKLILWTMRSDSDETKSLTDAVEWFKEKSIPLFGINENPSQKSWTQSPKAYAALYIDDAALGCPLIPSSSVGGRPMVNWESVESVLFGGVK